MGWRDLMDLRRIWLSSSTVVIASTERLERVPVEDRYETINDEDRYLRIPAEDRYEIVKGE